MRDKKKAGNANLPALILLAALIMFWQMAAMGINAAYILPSPTQSLVRLWELRGPLFTAHLPATMSVVAIGLLISVVLGLGLAILMDVSEVAEKALYPLIIASQTIPTTALAPLFVLWFGYSIWSKVLVTVLITFFPITFIRCKKFVSYVFSSSIFFSHNRLNYLSNNLLFQQIYLF